MALYLRPQCIHKKINMMAKKWDNFKAWMEYNPPYALTVQGWSLFEAEYKKRAPIRYFITNRVPKFFRPVARATATAREYIIFRTIKRFHVVRTDLAPGFYHIDERILHSAFTMLKDFVEVQKAIDYQSWHLEEYPFSWKEKLPLLKFFYRRPDLGIKHLEWEATLDDPSLTPKNQCASQAIGAREILALYKWWTETRPARTTPIFKSYNNQGLSMGTLDCRFDVTAADYVEFNKQHDEYAFLREQWDLEDDEMLDRLIKIRRVLWT